MQKKASEGQMRMSSTSTNGRGNNTGNGSHHHPSHGRRRISFEDEYDDVHSLVDDSVVGGGTTTGIGIGVGGAGVGGGMLLRKPDTLGRFLLQEARAVSLWSCIATLFRLALILLSLMANYPSYSSSPNDNDDDQSYDTTTTATNIQQQCTTILQQQEGDSESCSSSSSPTITDILSTAASASTRTILPPLSQEPSSSSTRTHEILLILSSTVAGLLLCLLPTKVATQQAPGFSLGNPWYDFWFLGFPRIVWYIKRAQRSSTVLVVQCVYFPCLLYVRME